MFSLLNLMIQQILCKGSYKFEGDLQDFKRCISSFKVTKVIQDGECLGIKIFEAIGKFKYHGETHKIHISRSWNDERILFIKYLGGN